MILSPIDPPSARLNATRLVIVSLLLLLGASCATATPTAEPAAISFAFHESDLRYYEGLLAGFSDVYPAVTVELLPMDWNQMAAITAQSADVFAATTSYLNALNERQELLALDPFLQQDSSLDLADFFPGVLGAVTHEGRMWALPSGVDVYVMYVNQDLFTQYGVTYPDPSWSWAEFLERALATRDEEMRVYGYTTTPGHWDAVLFIYQNEGRIVDSEQDPTKFVFDDARTIDALEWYADLFHEYDVAPTLVEGRTYFGGGNYAYYQGIRNGRVGMWMLPLSQRGGLMWPVEWLSEYRVAPPPQGSSPASTASLEAFAISSDTTYRDACWLWISYLSKQMTYRLMPARRSLAESEEYELAVGEEVSAAARISLENAVMFSPRLSTRLGAEYEAFTKAIGHIIEGTMTADEAMDWARLQTGG